MDGFVGILNWDQVLHPKTQLVLVDLQSRVGVSIQVSVSGSCCVEIGVFD